MSNYSIKDMKIQGKTARAVYGYKATMNDELNLKIDDIIVLTQCSEDETWLEGTLNGVTGWFPSNYVQILDDPNNDDNSNNNEIRNDSMKKSNSSSNNLSQKYFEENNILRIKHLNELKIVEEGFLDEICKFVKIALLPLQTTGEIFPIMFTQQLNSCLDDVIRCHQAFYQQLKEIPENSDAKIGQLLISMAPHFKQVYDSYAKINPKYVHSINRKKDALSKFFESSLSKMNSSLVPITSNMTVSLYMSKFLATPFRQLEIYAKLLREIQRYTEDYHVDRGDLQRSIEFYNELSREVTEIRKRKEYELDILSSKIHNLEENGDLFKNGVDFQFLSPVLIIHDDGERKDCILTLFQNCLIILTQNSTNQEFYFEYKIPFVLKNNSIIQFKKINVSNIEYINSHFGAGTNLQPFLTKYVFELSGLSLKIQSKMVDRVLIVCSSIYDFKSWTDLLTNCLTKLNKSITSHSHKQTSFRNITNATSNTSKQSDFASVNKENILNNKLPTPPPPAISASNATSTLNLYTNNRKVFSMRPHPALLPHFQLPNDSLQINVNDMTLKRFMYKKPKLSEPFGKYYGADDDLKLLNVIDTFCRAKVRHSVQINENSNKPIGTGTLTRKVGIQEQNNETNVNGNSNEKSTEKSIKVYLKKLAEDKIRLESTIQSISTELNESKNLNKELKTICSSLSKQLENERHARRRLENFIKKNFKLNQPQSPNHTDTSILSGLNIEHESSI